VDLGWVHKIVRACSDLSSSFAFFAGGLGVVIVAASLRGLVKVCASATGNILGVVSRWHLFPYLTFFADFSSFPFLGWCFSGLQFPSVVPRIQRRHCHYLHHEHSKRVAQARSPDEGTRAPHVVLLDQAHMGFFHYYQLFC